VNDDDQRPEPGPERPDAPLGDGSGDGLADGLADGPADGPTEAGPDDTEPTQPLGFARPTEPPAPSWVPPTTQPPPLQWSPFPPPGTQPLPPDPAQHVAPRGRVPGWIWPLIATVALVVGVVGGVAGGVAYDQLTDEDTPGTVSSGLSGVDTVSVPPLADDNGSVAAVAQALLPSTVQISAEFNGQKGGATGSGFVLDRQGHVITNNHVVADAASDDGPIEIVDQDGNRYEATIVGRSPVYDLAVLYAEGAKGLKPAALGASQALRVGEGVVAFGSPLGLSSTVTAGIVSALHRPVTTGDSGDDSSYINAVQTDAAINPGNSGGPLVNLRGEVVGVNSAIATTGGTADGESGNIGVGFAIPIEQVRTTADQILRTGEARYPVIGAKVQTGQDDGKGAEIDEVVADTPAEKSGLEKGDVVTAVDGERVTDGIALIVAIRSHQPGETLEFTVDRAGEEQTLTITLGSEVG
jgi:putative serine protease PepD